MITVIFILDYSISFYKVFKKLSISDFIFIVSLLDIVKCAFIEFSLISPKSISSPLFLKRCTLLLLTPPIDIFKAFLSNFFKYLEPLENPIYTLALGMINDDKFLCSDSIVV